MNHDPPVFWNLVLILADGSAKAVGLALIAGLLLRLGHVKDVAVRHAAYATVLCGMLFIPLLSVSLPRIALPIGLGVADDAGAIPNVMEAPRELPRLPTNIGGDPVSQGTAAARPQRHRTSDVYDGSAQARAVGRPPRIAAPLWQL